MIHIFKINSPFNIIKRFNGETQRNVDGTETQIMEITVKCRVDCVKHCEYDGDIEILSDYNNVSLSEKKEV